ncbi:Leucine-rich repeat [Dillenia turbinata]|uniref:non-specific serine/threonine protein kinase n=1 Tax=Dillenia turbinata TaxID=194707 RepID=A0AAN8UUR9_9MAGN
MLISLTHSSNMLTGKHTIFRQRKTLYLLCFLIFFSIANSTEIEILLKFKSSIQNSSTTVFDTWRDDSAACNFSGIACDPQGLVKEISIPQQDLEGEIPFDAICELKSLQKIDLGGNSIGGNIGEGIRNCTKLQYLDLGYNSLNGKVPDLSSLTEMKFLNLNASGISGPFPWKSLENLTPLEFLSLGDNPFEKNPFPLEVLNLKSLYWLYLTNSSIEGKIPEGIGNLTNLQNLELSDNLLSGEIPASITKLTKLWQLELYNNSFTGKIPAGFGNLTGLINFDASTNFLLGDLSELKSLTRIVSLQLFENQLAGPIPEEFGEFKFLEELSLYTNKLTGTLPQALGSWSDFNYIDVAENSLTGAIPPNMCNKGKMSDLLLLQNHFTGSIPESYANCSSLVRFRVNNNSLSGIVPAGIWNLPNLEILDFRSNQFQGPISTSIGNSKSLAQLFLSNNQFSGELPESISQATSLVSIYLSSNQIEGKIPDGIGNLKMLNALYLDSNMLSAEIPTSLSQCESLNDINLSNNYLTGEIPDSLGSLSSLNSLNLSENKLSGEIPVSLSSPRLSLLDLSNNRLVGPVPFSLSLEAYNESFVGNPGLCSQAHRISYLRPCGSDSGEHSGEFSGRFMTIVVCLVVGTVVSLGSFVCFIYIKMRRNDHDHWIKGPSESWEMRPYHVISFSEEDIIKSIKRENLIGQGGSGDVYKVVVNGMNLAVKHVWRSDLGERQRWQSTAAMLGKKAVHSPEYEAEVATLSSLRHVNVVKLYCSISGEGSHLLVYEYLVNGSLWDRMHTCQKTEMDWNIRYEIAVGAARGLEYLHHGCNRPVIHRDVKSRNILLDEDLKPRIADFGLAKIMHVRADGRDSTRVVAGTHGYIAPEYAYTYKVNEKSDVYSFGVVLMELVTGKRPLEPELGEDKDLVQWVNGKLRSNADMIDLVDSGISDTMKEDAVKVLRIALHCTVRVPALRPSMRMVVQMLEEAEPGKLTKGHH